MNQRFGEQSETTERQVVSMEWEGKAARAVITRRIYPTGIEDLWDAIVTPERLKRWFLPISGELREGGSYQLEGNANGTINRCEAPHHLAITWEMHGGMGWVNVKLEAIDQEATRMTLEHIAHEDPEFLGFWEQFGPGSLGVGWDIAIAGLAEHLRTGGEGTFAADEASWMKTDDGRSFVRTSSDAWVDAEIAFGTDAPHARSAGDRTFEFYTGS